MNALEENSPRGRDQSPARTRQASAMFAKCFEAFKKDDSDWLVALDVVVSCGPTGTRVQGFAASSFRTAGHFTRSNKAAAIVGEQNADQEYYDLGFRHGEKLTF
jgi:hypothetical protein